MNRQPGAASAQVAVRSVGAGNDRDHDEVVVEEPLLIRLAWPGGDQAVSVTMRTPGSDAELALGFLFGEGILPAHTVVTDVQTDSRQAQGDSVTVRLAAEPDPALTAAERNFYMTSSCGICGKAALEAVRTRSAYNVEPDSLAVSAATLQRLPGELIERQAVFADTGSNHAAALFDVNGLRGAAMEDVGRHNALDKLIGRAYVEGRLPLSSFGIVVSGRASFELVQKACMAGSPILAAVGAPSSLAVDLAWEAGMTLVGFIRADRFNVYAAPDRVLQD